MPRGLGGLGICNYMYCPDDYNGVITTASDKSAPSINPHSITWQSWDWDKYGGDTNTYTVCDAAKKTLRTLIFALLCPTCVAPLAVHVSMRLCELLTLGLSEQPSDCITKHLGPGRIQDMPACDD